MVTWQLLTHTEALFWNQTTPSVWNVCLLQMFCIQCELLHYRSIWLSTFCLYLLHQRQAENTLDDAVLEKGLDFESTFKYCFHIVQSNVSLPLFSTFSHIRSVRFVRAQTFFAMRIPLNAFCLQLLMTICQIFSFFPCTILHPCLVRRIWIALFSFNGPSEFRTGVSYPC